MACLPVYLLKLLHLGRIASYAYLDIHLKTKYATLSIILYKFKVDFNLEGLPGSNLND